MIIVDTSVWFDYLAGIVNPESEWLDVHAGQEEIGIADLILCEILQGAPTDHEFEVLCQEMRKFEVFDTGGSEFALAAAVNYRTLRKEGITPRKTIDCWIATFC